MVCAEIPCTNHAKPSQRCYATQLRRGFKG